MTPEEALALTKTVTDLYAAAAADLLRAIGAATARGVRKPDLERNQLAQVLQLRREAQRIVSRLQGAGPVEAARLLGEVYAAQADLVGATGVNNRTVVALAADLEGRLRTLGPPLLRATEDAFRQVISETLAGAVTGVRTREQAAAAALDRFASAGVGTFVDRAGRRWSIESYAEMATRTAVGRAHLAGNLAAYADRGVEHVIISNSPEECPACRPYEGKVLSLGADTPPTGLGGLVYAGTLNAAVAAGLFHPSCTHRSNAFVPGLTQPMVDTENPQGYEDRQQQRTLERRVRESKRRVAALRPLGDTPTLRRQEQLLASRTQQLDEFVRDRNRKAGVSRRRTQIPGGLPPKPPRNPSVRTPAGAPVSDAITVASGTRDFKSQIQDALDAIDAVHGDGRLPVIDLLSSSRNDLLGFYTPGSPRIQVGKAGDWPALTAVHEIGHFLDHKGIGNPKSMATSTGALQGVLDAIHASDTVDRLRTFDLSKVRPSVRSDIDAHIQYLLSDVELWARAYAQWVTVRSGQPRLEADLVKALGHGKQSGILRQWSETDFAEIAEAVDELMGDLGWMA